MSEENNTTNQNNQNEDSKKSSSPNFYRALLDLDLSSPQKSKSSSLSLPNVFDYSDFRAFLKDCFEYRKEKNPSYSETAFIRQAGLGANSRGYLSLIVEKKRNLSQRTVAGFARALKLTDKEALYFENLVFFNQAQSEKDKAYYLERLKLASKGKKSKAFDILESQYRYFSQWYLVAIREMVALEDFQEDSAWIAQMLRGKITKKEATAAIEDLLTLGLIVRDGQGGLKQAQEFMRFNDDIANHQVVESIHKQFLNQSVEAMDEDSYRQRSVAHMVLGCESARFEEMREDIKEFRLFMMEKYGKSTEKSDCILVLGSQLRYLTPIKKTVEKK